MNHLTFYENIYRMKHKRQSIMGKNGDEKGVKSGSLTNDEDSMDLDAQSAKGGNASGSETGLDLDKSALSPDDSNHSQSSRDEMCCEKPTNSTPMIDPNQCCSEPLNTNRNINVSTTGSPSVLSPHCEDVKISVSNATHLLHSALSSVNSSPATRNALGSPSSVTISPKGHQSPSEHLNCATIHAVNKVRNWTPNTRQPLNTLNAIECHSNHNNMSPINTNSSVNCSTSIAQPLHTQHPPNGCNYYNRCVSTSSSSPLSSSSTSTTLSYGRRQRYSTQLLSQNSSRSSPSNTSATNFCYRTSPSESFPNARTAQQSTTVSAQDSLTNTKFFSNPTIANGPNGSLYAQQQQQTQQSSQLQQRTHYFSTDYNCDYPGVRSAEQLYPQRQPYEPTTAYIDSSGQQYLSSNGTIGYATHTTHANHTNYANIVNHANQVPDQESYGSENNGRAQNNSNAYSTTGAYYELAANSNDHNSHRIPSEYNAIALKQQPIEYSSQTQQQPQQYYDIQNNTTTGGLALAVSPNIPNTQTFDSTFCNSNSNNSTDLTATSYNNYNTNYYDVYNNCTNGMTNTEFNFINIANEFTSPEYYQLS